MMTRRDLVAERHGSAASSGADSVQSVDTVRNLFHSSSRRRRHATPIDCETKRDKSADRDLEISPGSAAPRNAAAYGSNARIGRISSAIAPWDTSASSSSNTNAGDHRKEVGMLDPKSRSGSTRVPTINRQPPNALSTEPNPWDMPDGNGPMPSSVFGSFYNDSNEDLQQLSPGFRPGSSQDDMMKFPGEDRRPSVASATTVSSQNSKSSVGRNFQRKLHGFFGEDFPGVDNAKQSSDPYLVAGSGSNNPAIQRVKSRTNATQHSSPDATGRPISPSSHSRPHTPAKAPHASSEVTPWDFQDNDNDEDYPYASRQASFSRAKQPKPQNHRLHLPGHRHTKSKEEPKTQDFSHDAPLRPVVSREESAASLRRNDFSAAFPSAYSSTSNLSARPASPSSSTLSTSNMSQRSPLQPQSTGKRSLLDKFRGRHKHERAPDAQALKDASELGTSSTSLQQPRYKPGKLELPPEYVKKRDSDATIVPQKKGSVASGTSKEVVGRRIPFKSTKKESYLQPPTQVSRDPNEVGGHTGASGALWNLDTDLTSMEGIVNAGGPMTPPGGNHYDIFTGYPPDDKEALPEDVETGAWDAPDSWAVKKIADENLSRMKELDDDGHPSKEASVGSPYCVRIFRADSTFAVLSVTLNTTVSDIVGLIGKKTFLQDDLQKYQIVMKKHDTSRQLEPNERPLVIQKKLLEQAGYVDSDRLEDVGREDNSYLCRFTFLPSKMTGYSSLDRDPGFGKVSKFSHIDLQGRNLITIPIMLYQKATEIISLNLSRNLSLDIPKDFIQACTNLREIKYTSNEAWRIPPSISLAARLTMLDVSNNKLEQLEHADLQRLQSLISLRLSNNKLSALPEYFGQFRALRSLNLSSNSLSSFPDYMCKLQTLVDVDISFNAITELPQIGNLKSLERLWATNNKLSGPFPPSAANLANLRELDVRFNQFDNIDVLSQLQNLEYLMVGNNKITGFEGTFNKIRVFHLNNNPVTRFGISMAVPTLSNLNIERAKLAALPDDLFQKIPNLTKLILDKNHFVSISPHIGSLVKLEHLSMAQNQLNSLPDEIGRLVELRFLDLRENNLSSLPSQIWFAKKLESLNLSSNVLNSFPKPGEPMPAQMEQLATPALTPGPRGPAYDGDELGSLEDFYARRPSHASLASGNYFTMGQQSPNIGSRKSSTTSVTTANGRRPSFASTAKGSEATIAPIGRKDSSLSNRMLSTFAVSLKLLYLADNRLQDEVFDELALLPELRVLNLSYNLLYDIPPRTLRRWTQLAELYLSGNDFTALPAEDLEELGGLRILMINNNKFQVLPAELAKVQKLSVMDVGSNALKYNVSNWPYDWNWNWNHNLRYLNMSGNKRLEIKPSGNYQRGQKDLTDFTSLQKLRILGLMDVTLMVQSWPDQTEDRRVRTAGSQVGALSYGMADYLGRNEHLSIMDMVIDRFRSHEDELTIGMFDGQALPNGGSKIAKYLYDHFKNRFQDELERLRDGETPGDALRRTFLGLNKDVAVAANGAIEARTSGHRTSVTGPELGEDDLHSGCVATVLYLKDGEMYVANVGDATALLIQTEGSHKVITTKHDPADATERQRIQEAGGFVSRHGKLNDHLEVSRAFGYVQMAPAVIAAPYIMSVTIKESDEMVLIASRELWKYMSKDFAVDMARSERGDLMRAAQKLRDLAIAFGASDKLMVMILGISDLRKRERARYRTHSMSMGPSGQQVDDFYSQRRKRGREQVGDSRFARLDQEVDAPTGEVTLVFTDIKSSTLLWETYPIAMRSAIKIHNDVMRRHLRIIGGYEVKTEGDAFMVAFPTVTSALLWCFTTQMQLLEAPWPQEILSSVNGQEVTDADDNIIFKGLSVRMGVHWGRPVWEVDPVTKRMDYFGPMVNRASRISSVADGGQITVSSDFIAEIQRLLETNFEVDRSVSTGSEETLEQDALSQAIRRELRSLSSQGFEVKDLGERKLKGLENPEYIYLMYPHALASRMSHHQQHNEAQATMGEGAVAKTRESQLTIDIDNIWQLWSISLRLEMLCSTLECPGSTSLKPPETALLERMKEKGGEVTDHFLVNFVEHQISRIETCITTLTIRNMLRPFKDGMLSQAAPMSDILGELQNQLSELAMLKANVGFEMAPS